MKLIAWLRRFFHRDTPDPAWKATGLRFVSGRDYIQANATAMWERSQKHTATGRRLPTPKPAKKAKPVTPAAVVPFKAREAK